MSQGRKTAKRFCLIPYLFLFSASFLLLIPSSASAIRLSKKAQRKVANAAYNEVLEKIADRLINLENRFEELGERRRDVRDFDRYLDDILDTEEDIHRDNTNNLNTAFRDQFTADTRAGALEDFVVPHQQDLLDLLPIFEEQANLIPGPNNLNGNEEDRLNAVSDGQETLEYDFRTMRDLTEFIVDHLKDLVRDLKDISNDRAEQVMPHGKPQWASGRAEDVAFLGAAVKTFTSYINNTALDGSFAPAILIGYETEMVSLEDRLAQIVTIAQSAPDHGDFRDIVQDTVLNLYFGNDGYKDHWRGVASDLQEAADQFEAEAEDAENNNQPQLAAYFIQQRDERLRQKLYADFQTIVIDNHAQILRDARDVASRMSNEERNGPDTWRKTPTVIQNNIGFMMPLYPRMFFKLEELLLNVQLEINGFLNAQGTDTEIAVIAGIVAAKIEAMYQDGGAFYLLDEQETSSIEFMQGLKNSVRGGGTILSFMIAVDTWFTSTTAKYLQYSFDLDITLPQLIADANQRIVEHSTLLVTSTRRLQEIRDKIESYETEAALFQAVYDRIDEFFDERPYRAIFELLIGELMTVTQDSGFTRGKKLRLLERKIARKMARALTKAENGRSLRKKKKRGNRAVKAFRFLVINRFLTNFNSRVDSATSKVAEGDRIGDLVGIAEGMVTEILNFE